MRPKNYKGVRCIKQQLSKCSTTVKTYDKIQTALADLLEHDTAIESFSCNVLLEGLPEGEYTTDFLCKKTDGDYCVRECVFRSKLSLPRTCKLLDISRQYWLKRGIHDWAIVVEMEADHE